jgi:Ca2+-binding RTX toxin-like protein
MSTRTARRAFRPSLNALESRHLLTGVTANLSRSGVLSVVGTEAADVIRLTQSGTRIRVEGASTSFVMKSVRQIRVDGRAGNDVIEVSLSPSRNARGKLPLVTIDGGSGMDAVRVRGVAARRVDVDTPESVWPGLGAPVTVPPSTVPPVVAPPAPGPVVSWVNGVGTLDYSAWTTPVVVDLRAGTAPGVADTWGITRVIGGQADDTLLGSDGDDVLIGGGGNDWIEGRGGNDRIEGNDGVDLLFGGTGDDVIDGGAGVDFLDGGDGNDELRGGTENDILDGGAGDDRLWGGAGGDVIFTGDGLNTAFGEEGNDLLIGGSEADTLSGGAGTDFLFGLAGNDVIDAGDDNDFIDGGSGADTLRGGAGNDVIEGGTGNDRIEGGSGDDLLFGSDGDDVIEGGAGVDLLVGGAGRDVLRGGDQTDILFGGTGDDSLYGDAGSDLLLGGDGSDELRGGDGLDILDGGYDYDYIWGEGGDDIYIDDLVYLWGVPVYIGANTTYLSDPGFNIPLDGHLTIGNSYLASNIASQTTLAPTSSNNLLSLNSISPSTNGSDQGGAGLFYSALDYNIKYTTSTDYGLGHVALGGFAPTSAWVAPSMQPLYGKLMSRITGFSPERALQALSNSRL